MIRALLQAASRARTACGVWWCVAVEAARGGGAARNGTDSDRGAGGVTWRSTEAAFASYVATVGLPQPESGTALF